MTTIILEVPDELATRIRTLREPLPDLLARTLNGEANVLHSATTHPVYQEMMDFLAKRPTPQQIITFRISDAGQERLSDLLEKNREEGLTVAENAELDVYELVHHSFIRLKAQARLQPS